MSVLVIGASRLADQVCQQDGEFLHMLAPSYRDVVEVLGREKPTAIINLSQLDFIDVEQVERNSTQAVKRAVVSGQVAIAAQGAGVPLIHLSSSLVFSGAAHDDAHRVGDTPNPAQALGMAFLWAERAVEAWCQQFLIVRIGWLFGVDRPESWPYRVITESYEETVKGEKAKRFCRVPDSPLGTPTYDQDAAALLALHTKLRMTDQNWTGVVHMGPREYPISWFEFCEFIGIPLRQKLVWNWAAGFIPQQQALVPTPGWVTNGYLRSAALFLEDWKASHERLPSGEAARSG